MDVVVQFPAEPGGDLVGGEAVLQPQILLGPSVDGLRVLHLHQGVFALASVQEPFGGLAVVLVLLDDDGPQRVSFEQADAELEAVLVLPCLLPLESGQSDLVVQDDGFDGGAGGAVHEPADRSRDLNGCDPVDHKLHDLAVMWKI